MNNFIEYPIQRFMVGSPTFRNCPKLLSNSTKSYALSLGELLGHSLPCKNFRQSGDWMMLLERAGTNPSIWRAFTARTQNAGLRINPATSDQPWRGVENVKIKMDSRGWRDPNQGLPSQPKVWGDLQLSKDEKFPAFLRDWSQWN